MDLDSFNSYQNPGGSTYYHYCHHRSEKTGDKERPSTSLGSPTLNTQAIMVRPSTHFTGPPRATP